MDRIQLLDDSLINKIAAGEVVERPSSVVKELVENAIDAGASKITVDVQDGGRKRILVSDNGCGMSANDARTSLLRHATSKIKTAEDLFNLKTMGFRGEALASISSVCRFTLMTCEQGVSEGVRIQMSGSVDDITLSPWQSSGGTTVICDDLFFNVPVRKKFLKAAGTEYGAVLEMVQALSLAHPAVEFTLIHNSRETLRAAAVKQFAGDSVESVLRKRFLQIIRADGDLGMVYVEAQSQWASMSALVSPPGVERSSSKDMFLFVNGRWVKDKNLRFAALRGYHSHLLRGRYPVVALFLNVDSGLVDANVHPAKTEVRLQYSHEINDMIATAIRNAIRRADWASAPAPFVDSRSDRDITTTHSKSLSNFGRVTPVSSAGSPSTATWRDVTPNLKAESVLFERRNTEPDAGKHRYSSGYEIAGRVEEKSDIPWSDLEFLGSFASCYLMFSYRASAASPRLLVIDQHAFHERIIYERLLRDHNLLKASQPLLVPECVSLSPKALSVFREMMSLLHENGFKVEVIDESHVEVRAIPALLSKCDVAALIETICEQADQLPLKDNVGLAHDILATFACHSAVRAGEDIGSEELKVLVKEASEVDFFHNCPHGRRVLRWWDESQVSRWFDR